MASFHLSISESILITFEFIKTNKITVQPIYFKNRIMADTDHVELPSMSSHDVSERQNQEGEHLNPNRQEPESRMQRLLKPKNIFKFTILLALFLFTFWLGNRFFSTSYMRTRKPSSLSSFSFGKQTQVMSPAEKDYRSFYFFQKLQEKSTVITKEKRDPLPTEVEEFQDIKFKQFYNIFKVVKTIQLAKQYSPTQATQIINNLDLNQAINFTEYFNQAVDQFQCGSCYSFPITATVQFLYKKLYNITVKLSEQQLIDCVNDDPTSNGCDDGDIQKGFEYVRDHGLVASEHYPYRSFSGKSFACNKTIIDSPNITRYKISGFHLLPKGNCSAIQEKLQEGRAVATMINAENIGSAKFDNDEAFTDCKRSGLNHAVTIVGQTEKNSWIVRNSWGKSWGKNGYFVMGHGNTCGACLYSIAPELRINSETKSVMTMEEIAAENFVSK